MWLKLELNVILKLTLALEILLLEMWLKPELNVILTTP
jgi:hypothetical protein